MRYSPLLVLHICGGTLGLLAGAVAISLRKGSRRHGIAGNVFVAAMLVMSSVGAYLALVKSQMNNVFGGVLTFYLVATAWRTARSKEGETSIFDWVGLLVVASVGAVILSYGVAAATSPSGTKDGLPAGIYFFLGSVAVISTAGDIRLLVRGGISGRQRLARHLWRMCFALFVASGSVFLAREQLFPNFLRRSGALYFLSVLPLLLMVFWLIRVRFAKAYKKDRSAPSRGPFPLQPKVAS